MPVREIFVERLPMHPLLGRHVFLDSMSKDYAVQPSATSVVPVRHPQYIPILDQGQIGACTGNASCSCAYHAPFFIGETNQQNWQRYTPDEPGALNWYEDNTANDDYQGTYTPDDTGSDGLTSSKMAVKAGVASGYQAALDLDSSLQQLTKVPGITGLPWYNSMFNAPSSGLLTVTVSSGLAGGHELCVDEIVGADSPGNGTGKLLVGGPNSWGESFGAAGRWYLTADDWWSLRKNNGDVYFWTPPTLPAPTPIPDPTQPTPSIFDIKLWENTDEFRADHHTLPHIRAAAKALDAWGKEWGFHV